MGEGGEGGNRVRVDHQRELQLVESCFQSRVGRDHCSGGVATREGVVTELLACDAASLEHHLVLGQRARLVAEHVLHLPELLGDVERPALDSLLMHLVPHQGVVVDQVNLGDLGQLNRHIEGKGDDDLENDDESPESQEASPERLKLVKGEEAMEGSQGSEGVEPKATTCRAKEAEGEQDQDAPDHLQVDLSLKFTPLVPRPTVVQHRLRLMTSVDDQALDVVGVLEETLPEQEVVLAHRDPLAPRLNQRAMEPINLCRWSVALQLCSKLQRIERPVLGDL